ncbi:MAG: hypothetical protein CSA26_11055 [Desulfobacterales bacterium]|nr:MAG: hypothetical protein CSA26_11055 [Desulfobacterales bacterium]
MTDMNVPEIAVIGHPNEGKSSVLSTLAEDDSVRISNMPGETTSCQTFPVAIDGREMLRFTDTPGFQNPQRVLAELQKLTDEDGDRIIRFREIFKKSDQLRDDVELLKPVERGAGIIYVVDGSRPVRNVDRAEMEILRLTGRPRMAIINCKDNSFAYIESWKNEFRRSFNTNRVFNAHRATYAERILLLEALKSVDQDWQQVLDRVINAFKADWHNRNLQTVDILLEMFSQCLQHTISAPLKSTTDQKQLQEQLFASFHTSITDKEKKAHIRIERLYKHNIFNYSLPEYALLNEEIFSKKTWELFGLSKKQLAVFGGLGGAALGAGLDLAAGGMMLGLATGLAGAAGAIGTLWGGRKLSSTKIMGIQIGGEKLQMGPVKDINLLFVLINRALLHYKQTINWAHGRRDYETVDSFKKTVHMQQNTASWSTRKLKAAKSFFSAVTENEGKDLVVESEALRKILQDTLAAISHEETEV